MLDRFLSVILELIKRYDVKGTLVIRSQTSQYQRMQDYFNRRLKNLHIRIDNSKKTSDNEAVQGAEEIEGVAKTSDKRMILSLIDKPDLAIYFEQSHKEYLKIIDYSGDIFTRLGEALLRVSTGIMFVDHEWNGFYPNKVWHDIFEDNLEKSEEGCYKLSDAVTVNGMPFMDFIKSLQSEDRQFKDDQHVQLIDIDIGRPGHPPVTALFVPFSTQNYGLGLWEGCIICWPFQISSDFMDDFQHSREERYILFEKSPFAVAIIDQNADIIRHNEAFSSITESENQQIKSLFDLIDIEPNALLNTLRDQSSNKQQTGHVTFQKELTLKNDSGKVFSGLFCLFFQASNDPSEKTHWIVYMHDITEQKNLEKQFTQSQKMQAVGQLAGGVAHDFNNLLTAMIGFCDLILARHHHGEQTFADVMQIKQNSHRGANLVRQLLAFSRQQTLQPKLLNVNNVLAEITHLLRRLIGVNIELKIKYARSLGMVLVDQGQLEQVIVNLVVNARDAMQDGGELKLVTEEVTISDRRKLPKEQKIVPAGHYILIKVCDTGCGIQPEHLARIFEPFFSTKKIGSGTGLGLSTVYGIVKQTGGYVFADSEINKGTCFTIYIPLADEAQHAQELAQQKPSRSETVINDLTGQGRILIAEDEDSVRMFTARALKQKGYEILEAATGKEALDVIEEYGINHIDLLITDLVMPEMDGAALIAAVQKMDMNKKIICVSGYAEDALREKLNASDSVEFLSKPYSLKDLAGRVKEMLNDPI